MSSYWVEGAVGDCCLRAADSIRSRIDFDGAFPVERVSEVLPIRFVIVPNLGWTYAALHESDGCVVFIDGSLEDCERRWWMAVGVGVAVLRYGWLTGAPIDPVGDCELFARELLAPLPAVEVAVASGGPDSVSRTLGIPEDLARRLVVRLGLSTGPAATHKSAKAVRF